MAGMRGRSEAGFSLVELTVVVMIIGILVAIGIPSLLGARERSQNRAAQANLRHGIAAANVAYQDEEDYTLVTASQLNLAEPSLRFSSSSANPSSNTSDKTINYQVSTPTRIVMGVEAANGYCYYAQDNKDTTGANRGSTFMDGPSALGTLTGCTTLDGDPADPQLGVDDVDWDNEL